jgi:ribonuclease J
VTLDPAGFLRHRESFALGPFTITPFLNDHSAFDTYSMLIEADGRRLFYSADLQAHGRKAGIFEEFLRKPPMGVDVVLMEGTNVRQEGDPKSGKTEQEVEKDLIQTFKAIPGIVLAMYSAQNIDRLVTIFRACIQSGRHLVLGPGRGLGRSSDRQPAHSESGLRKAPRVRADPATRTGERVR